MTKVDSREIGGLFSTPTPAEPAPAPALATPVHPLKTLQFDVEGIAKKYREEREKRIRPDNISQFKPARGAFSQFQQDNIASVEPRDPIHHRETQVVVIGAGFSGIVTAVELRNHGVNDFLIFDKAGGFGGTWYWNQYPGATCDLESLVYLPLLEETGYLPSGRFPPAAEILQHVERIAKKWNLTPNALFHTGITSASWDESIRRWHVRTDRSDHIIAQYLVLGLGTFHAPKLPGIPGIETFERPHFHSGRWNFEITGGDNSGNMTKLADKTVGVIGTGCSGVQIVPQLARDAKKLYVFQRTPTTIQAREIWKTDPELAKSLKPGWQRALMRQFANIFQGDDTSNQTVTATEGFDDMLMQTIVQEGRAAGVTEIKPDEIGELVQLADLRVMERIRKNIEETVVDKNTAEKLKPWYNFFCKRPAFNSEYLTSFNRPNVELIDTDGKGVSRLSKTGVVANDVEHEVDVLVYATGFDFEVGYGFYRRTGIHVTGTQGQTPDQAWDEAGGPSTLFGIHQRGFPNFFTIGPVQGGVGANWTQTGYVAGEHIAEVISSLTKEGKYEVIEPTAEAEDEWGKQFEEGADARLKFSEACTPGYNNKEGKPEEIPGRWGFYPKGIVAWETLMREWREDGHWKGMERR